MTFGRVLHCMQEPEDTRRRGRITVWLVSSFTSLDSTWSLHPNNNIFSPFVKSNIVKLETNCTVMLPPMVIVLWKEPSHQLCNNQMILRLKQGHLSGNNQAKPGA